MSTITNFVAPLSNLAIVEVSGEQRHEYLHGQLTVATHSFSADHARLTAHCDFKGKMFAALYISEYNGAFLLTMHPDAAEQSVAQLKKYGVFSKVDITESTSLKAFGLAGDTQQQALSVLFEDLTSQHMAVCSNEYGQVITFNDTSLRFLCLLNANGETHLQNALQAHVGTAEFGHESNWEALEISAGLANVQAASMSEFVPQMLNFQALNAIDFDKGCYMGQEVVARTKFLGKNKRATFILHASASARPEQAVVGANVEIQIEDNWRRGGIINRISASNEQILALAVMANDTEAGSVVRLKDTDLLFTVMPLPYALDEQ
ncbi:MAG: tRNA-modifying protein YgfZ [Glaciecola sp.]